MRYTAYRILHEVMYQNGYSNILLKDRIDQFSKQDKALITSIVYGSIQNFDLLKYQLKQTKYKRISQKQTCIIIISLYQKHFLDKVPDYAIISEAMIIAHRDLGDYDSKFINAILSKLLTEKLMYQESDDELSDLATNSSHPLWLVKMLNKQYGMDYLKKYLDDNHLAPQIHLRYNTLSKQEDKLSNEAFVKSSFVDSGYQCLKGGIVTTSYFKDGIVTLQDFASQQVALYLNPSEDSLVLDMCAAPGGKTAHMAAIMENTGCIEAFDIHEHKIGLLRKNNKRLLVENVVSKVGDATKLIEDENYLEKYDYILCDALCTGLGVIKRKPEIKYQDITTSMDFIIKEQAKLLDNAYYALKKGGTLVYSTCTNNKKENEKQIISLLERYPDLELLSEENILGFEHNTDTFYMAKLIKKTS